MFTQLNLFFIALSFLTRIPVPASVDFSQQKLNQASRYFPSVGLVVGAICALVYWLVLSTGNPWLAIIVSMLAGVLVTGAFHEDGLADTCDGLGGGWTVEQKLKIMKDSRVGSYGLIASWFSLTLKLALLMTVPNVIFALLIAHPLSRVTSTLLIHFLPYVADIEQSKVKPLAESAKGIDLWFLVFSGAVVIAAVVIFRDGSLGLTLFLVQIALLVAAYHFLKKQIGGFTGDTLGAVQQVSELSVYFCLAIGANNLVISLQGIPS